MSAVDTQVGGVTAQVELNENADAGADSPWACLWDSTVPERCMWVLRSCVAVIRLDFCAGDSPELLGLGLDVGLLQTLDRSWKQIHLMSLHLLPIDSLLLPQNLLVNWNNKHVLIIRKMIKKRGKKIIQRIPLYSQARNGRVYDYNSIYFQQEELLKKGVTGLWGIDFFLVCQNTIFS